MWHTGHYRHSDENRELILVVLRFREILETLVKKYVNQNFSVAFWARLIWSRVWCFSKGLRGKPGVKGDKGEMGRDVRTYSCKLTRLISIWILVLLLADTRLNLRRVLPGCLVQSALMASQVPLVRKEKRCEFTLFSLKSLLKLDKVWAQLNLFCRAQTASAFKVSKVLVASLERRWRKYNLTSIRRRNSTVGVWTLVFQGNIGFMGPVGPKVMAWKMLLSIKSAELGKITWFQSFYRVIVESKELRGSLDQGCAAQVSKY